MALHDYRILVQHSAGRMILHYPHHHMVQVIWNRSALYFSETEFTHLMDMLQQVTLEDVDFTSAALRISHAEDGCVELWMGTGGLHLLPFDFLLLSSMLWEALTSLGNEEPGQAPPQPPARQEPAPQQPYFSAN